MSVQGACRKLGADFDEEFIHNQKTKLIEGIKAIEARSKDHKHLRRVACGKLIIDLGKAKRLCDLLFINKNLDRAIAKYRDDISNLITAKRKTLKIYNYNIMNGRHIL
jgi:hypothetical protein